MLNAEAARIITRSVRLQNRHAETIRFLMDRINGAASAGESDVSIEITGNVITDEDAQQIAEVLQGGGFAVSHLKGSRRHVFKISWA